MDPTEVTPLPKEIYAVRLYTEEGGCAVKRMSRTEHHWVLISDNPEYPPIAVEKDRFPNLVIGRVIWSWTSWVR
ncbi:MAG: S24 family peptidase [Candidatus Methanomethyliaceae archaeon]